MPSFMDDLLNQSMLNFSSDKILNISYFNYLCGEIKRWVRPPFDVEDLAQNLWIRAIKLDRPLYRIEIKHATYDALRSMLREQVARENSGLANRHVDLRIQDDDDELSVTVEQLETLIENTNLGVLEKMVILFSFYYDDNDQVVSEKINRSRQFVGIIKRDIIIKLRMTAYRIFSQDTQNE